MLVIHYTGQPIVLLKDDLKDAVAAGILYPFLRIGFKPELAGLAMALSSVTVITLSLMLKRYIPPIKKKEKIYNSFLDK